MSARGALLDGLENPSSVTGVNHAQDGHDASRTALGWSLRLNGCVAGTRQAAASTLKTSGNVEEAASLFIPGNSGCGRNGGRIFQPAINQRAGQKDRVSSLVLHRNAGVSARGALLDGLENPSSVTGIDHVQDGHSTPEGVLREDSWPAAFKNLGIANQEPAAHP